MWERISHKREMPMTRRVANRLLGAIGMVAGTLGIVGPVDAQTTAKPNILVIMGDDIGMWNISAYNRGMMGYHTPHIDRIALKGAIFTAYYGQQSCTPSPPALIT